ncbi:MAG: alpha/beta hydrolase [Candidatus Pacebacteria bacterium]|nr:alpha/beta hydrolase [Candidatus Paceibacterota bacterium]
MDGLAGHPETTFKGLKDTLESDGHHVVLVDTATVRTHEDRVQLVLDAYHANKPQTIFLVGFSAGGSAVRIAAERLERAGEDVAGVVLLAPAMPAFIPFATKELVKVMKDRVADIILGRTFLLSEREYQTLASPIHQDKMNEIVKSGREVSGVEARRLAFCPPRFVGYSYPTLHMWGSKDRWIAPHAQHRFGAKLRKRSSATVTSYEVSESGHYVLASEKRGEVVEGIQRWISRIPQ